MKIVFINSVGAIGGAEKVLLTVLTAILKAEPKIELHLIIGTEGLLVEKAKELGVQVSVLLLPEELNQLGDSAFKDQNKAIALLGLLPRLIKILPSLGKYLREFRRLLHEIKPDLIHSNGIKTHLLISLARIKDIPIIWHVHDFYGTRPLMARVLKWAGKDIKAAIAISQAVAEDVQAILKNLPIKVIYNAIDVNYFSPTPSSSHLPLRVGLVATFARWKGHDIFLKAISEIIKVQPDLKKVRFYIIGEPIYKTRGSQFSQEELKEKALELGITDKVDFLGFQDDIVKIYQWLDIIVHASTQPEPFGLVIVEAMSCGKPVVVSQAGGAAELFTHNYDAVGVPPREPLALASAILDLIDNPEKRQTISEKARQTAIERFNDQRLGKQLMEVYNLVLDSQ